jgi:hypothetical protein
VGIEPHDVPENRPTADFDHGLRPVLRLFPQAGPQSATQDDNGDALLPRLAHTTHWDYFANAGTGIGPAIGKTSNFSE